MQFFTPLWEFICNSWVFTPLCFSLQILKADGHLSITANGRIVQIKHTQVSDTGRYTCVATNIAGEDEKDFDVNIQGEKGFPSSECKIAFNSFI